MKYLLRCLVPLLLLLITADLAAQVTYYGPYRSVYQAPQPVSYTSYKIGNYSYTTSSTGTSYTSYRIGDYTYTSGSDGTSLTSYRIGQYTYTSGIAPPTSAIGATAWPKRKRLTGKSSWTMKPGLVSTTGRSLPRLEIVRNR